jgi:[NiFe] hydrogenase large subunit/hydrogenase large subunit
VGNYLTYGDGAPRTPDDPALAWWPAGVVRNRAMDGTPEALRSAAIGEYVTRSWYDYASGDLAHLHPGEGETQPRYTGPRPPYSLLDTTAGYSWLKSPRYDDIAAEVGPLARLVVGYASGREPVRSSVDRALADLGWPRESLFSTLGRMLARGIETGLYADQTLAWLDALEGRMDAGDTEAFDGARWDPATWPADVSGWGAVEAPRGALGHWVAIRGGRIAQYQVIAPSTWNGSPRDAANRRGPWEEALVGTPVADPDRPLEVLRTVHAFDPCLACAVHVVRARREVMRA